MSSVNNMSKLDLEELTEHSSADIGGRVNHIALKQWEKDEFSIEVSGILSKAKKVLLTGSRYICNVMDTDIDIMILVNPSDYGHSSLIDFTDSLVNSNWDYCSDSHYDNDDMFPLRKCEYNLLVTGNKTYFDKWALATHIATRLGLRSKDQRAFLFDAIIVDYEIK